MPKKNVNEHGVEVMEEILNGYNDKTAKDRKKKLDVVKADDVKCGINANRKIRPGVMSMRGCAYAGAKGVVFGPIKDMLHISHGPVGCGQYSWAARRNFANGIAGIDNYVTMQITSDFQEKDIVFGGDKKLEGLVNEANTLFPLNKGVSILSECPIGLIGDDIEAVARKTAKEIEKPVIPCRCEGFRGVSQSLGHHIANDSLRDWVYEKDLEGAAFEAGPYDVALIGDYNIGGDAWASRHCYRSMNYISRYIEEKKGIPWVEFNFFGPTQIFKSMRKIAEMFDDKIKEQTEKIIKEKYEPAFKKILDKFRPRLEGKNAMLFVGGLRPRHTIPAFRDLGVEVAITGYEFAHNDDYARTLEYLDNTTFIVDDMNEYELEKLIENFKPDLIGSGIKEKYYSGPYHGLDGFAVFARDMDMAINGPVWDKFTAPWK